MIFFRLMMTGAALLRTFILTTFVSPDPRGSTRWITGLLTCPVLASFLGEARQPQDDRGKGHQKCDGHRVGDKERHHPFEHVLHAQVRPHTRDHETVEPDGWREKAELGHFHDQDPEPDRT